MVENGFYNFLNWFDERAWYPLGRIVGGTVSLMNMFFKLGANCPSYVFPLTGRVDRQELKLQNTRTMR